MAENAFAPQDGLQEQDHVWNFTRARVNHLSWIAKYDSFLNWHEFDQNWFLNLGWGLT